MAKKITTISVLVISILLVSIYVISSTYSVIINVINSDSTDEIIDMLTIRDVLVDTSGNYNSLYYDIKRELAISYEEGETLIESVLLNNAFETIIKNVVDNKLHNKKRMSDTEIYNLIVTNVRNDDRINEQVKEKVINKTGIYINDITNYIYNFDIGVLS